MYMLMDITLSLLSLWMLYVYLSNFSYEDHTSAQMECMQQTLSDIWMLQECYSKHIRDITWWDKMMKTYYDQPSPRLPRICTAGNEKIIAPRLRQKLAADTTDAEIGK